MDMLYLRREEINLRLQIRRLQDEANYYELQMNELIYIVLALEKEVTEGEIAKHLPMNPFSIPAVKHVRKYFAGKVS